MVSIRTLSDLFLWLGCLFIAALLGAVIVAWLESREPPTL